MRGGGGQVGGTWEVRIVARKSNLFPLSSLDGGGDPSSLSKENGQYGAGGDDDSQHPQGLEERAHFLHGRHPLI